MQSDPQLRHDWIEFEKMPETVGVQINPFTYLRVRANANSAHITRLGGDWEAFYRAKRSSATRRRDRAKRKHIDGIRRNSLFDRGDARRCAAHARNFMEQKKRIFARKGIADIFARPGYHEFFLDFATNPQSRHLAHVSRIDVGTTVRRRISPSFSAIATITCCRAIATADSLITARARCIFANFWATRSPGGCGLFDFTIGDEPTKRNGATSASKLFDYSTAATWRGWPMSAASTTRRRLKRYIKQTPLIWRLVTRFRSTLGAFSQSRPT